MEAHYWESIYEFYEVPFRYRLDPSWIYEFFESSIAHMNIEILHDWEVREELEIIGGEDSLDFIEGEDFEDFLEYEEGDPEEEDPNDYHYDLDNSFSFLFHWDFLYDWCFYMYDEEEYMELWEPPWIWWRIWYWYYALYLKKMWRTKRKKMDYYFNLQGPQEDLAQFDINERDHFEAVRELQSYRLNEETIIKFYQLGIDLHYSQTSELGFSEQLTRVRHSVAGNLQHMVSIKYHLLSHYHLPLVYNYYYDAWLESFSLLFDLNLTFCLSFIF